MKKTPFFGATFVLTMALLASGTQATGDTDQNHDDTPTLRFITIDVPPWASRDPDTGEQTGAFIDIVDAIRERTGLAIDTSLTPFARVDRELESGDHDCTILVTRDQSNVIHGEVVANHDIGVISHKEKPIHSYEQLHGKTISLLRGSAISPEFDKDPDIDKVYDTDYLIALRKLARQRVAGVAGAIPTLQYLAATHELDDNLAPPLKLTDMPLMFQCSRQSGHLDRMNDINEAIETLKRNGKLQTIIDRHHF